jgi:hypothetical protein
VSTMDHEKPLPVATHGSQQIVTRGVAGCSRLLALLLAAAGDSVLNLIATSDAGLPSSEVTATGIGRRYSWLHSRANQPVVLSVIHPPGLDVPIANGARSQRGSCSWF